MDKQWQHPHVSTTNIDEFRRQANAKYSLNLQTYHDIWEWSTRELNDFWLLVWSFTKVVALQQPQYAIAAADAGRLFPRPTWFPGARLNYAQNILESSYIYAPHGDHPALTHITEGGASIRHFTLRELRKRVARMANALRDSGLRKGDRVACVCANSDTTFTLFLAVTSLGAIFTSCSPETGEKGILDRFVQVRPKILFADESQEYNGKRHDHLAKVERVAHQLRVQSNLQTVIVIPQSDVEGLDRKGPWHMVDDFVSRASEELTYEYCSFDDPMVIVYSSGTTGPPKCLVHTVGGVLLKLKSELVLGLDLRPDTVYMQYTTTNWIMYLYAISGMIAGARSILYDGSPTVPSENGFLDMLSRQGVTHFGTSASFLDILERAGVNAGNLPDFSRLEVITSTGSVLTESQYHWVYRTFGAIQLTSMAGGTDIAGAFVNGAPNAPVYAGWCQGRALGMDVHVYSDDGKAIEYTGQAGELVCLSPFPSQPLFFWHDATGEKMRSSYFERFHAVWTQGDFIRMDPATHSIQFLGRSDAVLNPSGKHNPYTLDCVRFGSAEIYNSLASYEAIQDSLCVGQRRPEDRDERVLLFVKMRQGHRLDDKLVSSIRSHIRQELSPRHVPAFIFETPEIPMTVNGKKTETVVKRIVCGQAITPSSTIVNPQALRWYEQYAWLDEQGRVPTKQAKL
ncbi:hypothetical protein CERZMDRAFT_113594 [Cercospora zeae-maydis SCOH1-5]|uniref:AMP-dependent synthetase/ligase domain-containing protein n=1 Tax=Cercospora zeae-maydis SCOH1-5 TaxID=717836 RepID=A0A6A6F8W1_9PEZI|nr:hypothetical protein CERZMDRAFT_113594 [Cercospora zeae-maydis SCOH1-5]